MGAYGNYGNYDVLGRDSGFTSDEPAIFAAADPPESSHRDNMTQPIPLAVRIDLLVTCPLFLFAFCLIGTLESFNQNRGGMLFFLASISFDA